MGEFNYSRLDLARRRRGLTKGGLAEAAGISSRNLALYEKQDRVPEPETLQRLAAALNFPTEFFSGPDLDELPIAAVSFRSLSRLSARERDQALAAGALALWLSDWIETHFNLPQPSIPQYPNHKPQVAAEAVREAWGLGERRVPNLIHLLEAHGVRVFSLAQETRTVDAFSFWRGSTPYVFLNTKKTAEHSRMDAAHELGHLVMHTHGGPRGRDAEHEAQQFGSAFLMPAGSVRAEAPRGLTNINQLARAKGRWNVAVANLAYRMHGLGLLTDWQYRSIFVELNKRGRTNEPVAPGKRPLEREASQVLRKVFRSLRQSGMPKAAVARELHISVRDLNDSVFGLVLTGMDTIDSPEAGRSGDPPELRVVSLATSSEPVRPSAPPLNAPPQSAS